jgi:hypothetical protein
MENLNKLYVGIMGPITECSMFIVDEILITRVVTMSLINMTGLETLLAIAKKELIRQRKTTTIATIDYLISEAKSTAKEAMKLQENNFNVINIHCIIALWGALEACIENMVTLILMNDPDAVNTLMQAMPTMRSIPKSLMEEDCFKIYKNIEREFRKNENVGEAYIEMLGVFGINVQCDESMLTKMAEINEIRNALLHRAGRINQRAIINAPKLKPYLDKKITIDESACGAYQNVVSEFTKKILAGIGKSQYI